MEWLPCGAGCGKSLAANLAEAKLKGLTWDESKLPEQDTVKLAQNFVQSQGFGADEKIICLNKLLKIKAAGSLSSNPKLVATYNWLETVQAMAVAGQSNFPTIPFTFAEVVLE